MRLLTLDIETRPNLADVWGLWQQNVAIVQLRESAEMICFAAKWHGEREILFYSQHHDGKAAMVEAAHKLVSDADAVIHFNGRRFDIPHLNREFLMAGKLPPAPFKQIDLFSTVKAKFKFPSYKLDYVAQQLGLGGKTKHEGHELWVKCMAGDPAAWERMKRYNKQDVRLTEKLYDRLLPWIPNHPSYAALTGQRACPGCGGTNLHSRGFSLTNQGRFPRMLCADCGRWSQLTGAVSRVDIKQIP